MTNGLTTDEGIHIAYSVKHIGVLELRSLQFPKRAQFLVSSMSIKNHIFTLLGGVVRTIPYFFTLNALTRYCTKAV